MRHVLIAFTTLTLSLAVNAQDAVVVDASGQPANPERRTLGELLRYDSIVIHEMVKLAAQTLNTSNTTDQSIYGSMEALASMQSVIVERLHAFIRTGQGDLAQLEKSAIAFESIERELAQKISMTLAIVRNRGIELPTEVKHDYSANPPALLRLNWLRSFDGIRAAHENIDRFGLIYQRTGSDSDRDAVRAAHQTLRDRVQQNLDLKAALDRRSEILTNPRLTAAMTLEVARVFNRTQGVKYAIGETINSHAPVGKHRSAGYADLGQHLDVAAANFDRQTLTDIAGSILQDPKVRTALREARLDWYRFSSDTLSFDPDITYLTGTPNTRNQEARANSIEHLNQLRAKLNLVGSQMVSERDGKILALRSIRGDPVKFEFVSIETGGFGEPDRYQIVTSRFTEQEFLDISAKIRLDVGKGSLYRPVGAVQPAFNATLLTSIVTMFGDGPSQSRSRLVTLAKEAAYKAGTVAAFAVAVAIDVVTSPAQLAFWSVNASIGKLRAQKMSRQVYFFGGSDVVWVSWEAMELAKNAAYKARPNYFSGGACRRLLVN